MAGICRSTATDCVTPTPTDFIDASMAKLTDLVIVYQVGRPFAKDAQMVIIFLGFVNLVDRGPGLRWAYTFKSGKVQTCIYRFYLRTKRALPWNSSLGENLRGK